MRGETVTTPDTPKALMTVRTVVPTLSLTAPVAALPVSLKLLPLTMTASAPPGSVVPPSRMSTLPNRTPSSSTMYSSFPPRPSSFPAPAHGVTERELLLTMIVPEAEPTANLLSSPASVPLRIAASNIEMSSAVELANELIVRVAPLPPIVAVPITSRLP
jgi:hypothetical protein